MFFVFFPPLFQFGWEKITKNNQYPDRLNIAEEKAISTLKLFHSTKDGYISNTLAHLYIYNLRNTLRSIKFSTSQEKLFQSAQHFC